MAQIYSDDTNQEQIKPYTLSVFTENYSGLLYRVTQIFTRRKINVESITASECEVEGVYRYTIVVHVTKSMAKKLTDHLEKLVDVLVAFYHEPEQTVYQEIALYKLKTETLVSTNVEDIVRRSNARFLSVDKHFAIVEKSGHKEETQELFKQLEPFGVQEFVRSGRVAIIKEEKRLSDYLQNLEELQNN